MKRMYLWSVVCMISIEWIERAEKDKYFFEDLDRRRNQGKPTSQEFSEDEMRQLRLFRDGAFFFYENSSANYQ